MTSRHGRNSAWEGVMGLENGQGTMHRVNPPLRSKATHRNTIQNWLTKRVTMPLVSPGPNPHLSELIYSQTAFFYLSPKP